jgi:ribosome-dependent ATPase
MAPCHSGAKPLPGYVRGMHNLWLTTTRSTSWDLHRQKLKKRTFSLTRRLSLVGLVAVIPLLLILIPTMLTSLSVVREKEMGSIVNLYVTPVTRLEFLVGKQLPYIALGMVNYLLLVLLAVTVFGIPFKGSFFALTLAALLYVAATTAMGLLISTSMRSQIAAIFGSAVLTMLPAQKFSGMLDPVSSLEGGAALISDVSHGDFLPSRGSQAPIPHPFLALVLTAPILLALSALFLKKQES